MIPLGPFPTPETFMDPDVTWVRPDAFDREFNYLVQETDMREQAAYTTPSGSMPGYINIQYTEAGDVQVTLRGEPQAGDTIGTPPTLTIPLDDFDQLLASFAHLPRPMVGDAPPTTPYPEPLPIEEGHAPLADTCSIVTDLTEEMNDAVENGAANGASAGDPLGMRSAAAAEDDDTIPLPGGGGAGSDPGA